MTVQPESSRQKVETTLTRWLRGAFAGLVGGTVATMLGVTVGGICSALFGQPFVGVTGWRGFIGGLVFPGLLMICPIMTPVGFVAGVVIYVWKCLRRLPSKGQAD